MAQRSRLEKLTFRARSINQIGETSAGPVIPADVREDLGLEDLDELLDTQVDIVHHRDERETRILWPDE